MGDRVPTVSSCGLEPTTNGGEGPEMADGRIVALWRYPVKSMQGEELAAVPVSRRGLLGDRAFAVVDARDGRVASAKDTRRWPSLFDLRAYFAAPPAASGPTAPVRIALPDGRVVGSDDPGVDAVLSEALNRAVRLLARALPDERAPEPDDGVGFFDAATLHLVTTSTLDRLRALYPSGRFDVRRFRPNIVIETNGPPGFVENAWVGKTVTIGDRVRLEVTEPCERCVMTTLAQADLPYDPGILTTAATANDVNVGVYARVSRGGGVARGQAVVIGAEMDDRARERLP
jgi:uncharacterized protein